MDTQTFQITLNANQIQALEVRAAHLQAGMCEMLYPAMSGGMVFMDIANQIQAQRSIPIDVGDKVSTRPAGHLKGEVICLFTHDGVDFAVVEWALLGGRPARFIEKLSSLQRAG